MYASAQTGQKPTVFLRVIPLTCIEATMAKVITPFEYQRPQISMCTADLSTPRIRYSRDTPPKNLVFVLYACIQTQL